MEYGVELHPWDLAEEGLDRSLAQAASLGVSRLVLTASWPGQAILRPRAPASRLHFPECGAVYFGIDEARWKDAPLLPNQAELVLIENYFDTLPVRAQREGLSVEARVVFLPYVPPASAVGRSIPQAVAALPLEGTGATARRFQVEKLYVRNAFGDRLPGYLCPAREEVRHYFIELVRDLARYDVSAVVLERYGFPLFDFARMPGAEVIADTPAAQFLMGACFCDSCVARGEAMNIETSPLAWRVRNFLERVLSGEGGAVPPLTETPDGLGEIDELLPAYLRARNDIVGTLVRDLREALEPRVRVTAFPGSRFPATRAWREGGEIARLAAGADVIRLQGGPAEVGALAVDLADARERAGGRAELSVRLRPGMSHGAGIEALAEKAFDVFAAKVEVAQGLGVESIVFAGLGELPNAQLKWIPRVTGA